MKRTTCKIFSDASYDLNTKKCGYGIVIVMNDLCIFKYGSIRGAKSSCEAEVMAAKKGLEYLDTKEFERFGRPVRKVVLLSDNHCVKAFDNEAGILEGWERSPKESKQRLARLIQDMRTTASKYDRGYRALYIEGHKNLEGNCDPVNRQLEYRYNSWCDRSARMNLHYGLRGKKSVKCKGFPDPRLYDIMIPMEMLEERLCVLQNSQSKR